MSRAEGELQLPLAGFPVVRIGQKEAESVLSRNRKDAFLSERKRRILNSWWEQEMYLPFRQAAQVWINYQGSHMATEAGMNVVNIGAEMAQHPLEQKLSRALRGARSRTITSQEIVDKARGVARQLETHSGVEPGWSRSYLAYFIDILAQEWRLSKKTTSRLKRPILQAELPGTNQLLQARMEFGR